MPSALPPAWKHRSQVQITSLSRSVCYFSSLKHQNKNFHRSEKRNFSTWGWKNVLSTQDDASFSNLKYEQDFPVPMWEYWLRFQVLSLYLSVGMNSKSYRFNWKNLDRNKKQNMVKSAKFLCNYAIVSWCRTLLSHCIFQWSKSWTITVVIGDIIFLRQEIS